MTCFLSILSLTLIGRARPPAKRRHRPTIQYSNEWRDLPCEILHYTDDRRLHTFTRYQQLELYTAKKAFRYSRPQPGSHLPNSPWAGIMMPYINYSRLTSRLGMRILKSFFYGVPEANSWAAPARAGGTDRPYKLTSRYKSRLPRQSPNAKLDRKPARASYSTH